MRQLLIRSTALLAMTFSLVSAAPLDAAAPSQPSNVDQNGNVVTATYEGQPIDPVQASHYFCHTRDYPVVRCFASEAEVARDIGVVEPPAPRDPGSLSIGDSSLAGVTPDWNGGAYTIAYWDINYGGSAIWIYGAVPNLGIVGWNDQISSFLSLNCGIPRYYVDANYGGVYWQDGCNSGSPNLASYNDTFSSVVNEQI